MTRYLDRQRPRRYGNTNITALEMDRGWLGTSLTRDPADAPPTSEYHHDFGPMQARCSGCRRLSVPRPSGVTPDGWSRDEDGMGRFFCPDCSTKET